MSSDLVEFLRNRASFDVLLDLLDEKRLPLFYIVNVGYCGFALDRFMFILYSKPMLIF